MITKGARLQWLQVGSVSFLLYIVGLIVVPFTILFSKRMANVFGETSQEHRDKYIDQGSSGYWYYVGCTVPFLQWFSNLEDGNYGEPSGKHSARSGGKEATFWQQYYWLALRNPYNYIKRTSPFFYCRVEDCEVTYEGDYEVDDKGERWGEQFVTATHKENGKKWYGYRMTKDLGDGKCRQKRYGFKIKPSHNGEIQDADDKDKAFTFRYQYRANIN